MPLYRQSVLVVEDEALIALELAHTVAKARAKVIGPTAQVQKALMLADDPGITLAILDYRLGAETSVPVALKLSEKQVPFIFYTARLPSEILRDWAQVPLLSKPAAPAIIVQTLAKAANAAV
jgi:DNA-binding response OmpR family regulator